MNVIPIYEKDPRRVATTSTVNLSTVSSLSVNNTNSVTTFESPANLTSVASTWLVVVNVGLPFVNTGLSAVNSGLITG